MVEAYENQSQYAEGTETVTLFVTDEAEGVSVPFALVGELSYKEAAQLGTLNVETPSLAIELDKANLSALVPKAGCKIGRDVDSTFWRVMSTPVFDHVIGVYRCLCNQVK